MEDLKGVINSQIASVITAGVAGKKLPQRSGSTASISGAELSASTGADDAVEQCAANLMKQFSAMGSMAGRKKFG